MGNAPCHIDAFDKEVTKVNNADEGRMCLPPDLNEINHHETANYEDAQDGKATVEALKAKLRDAQAMVAKMEFKEKQYVQETGELEVKVKAQQHQIVSFASDASSANAPLHNSSIASALETSRVSSLTPSPSSRDPDKLFSNPKAWKKRRRRSNSSHRRSKSQVLSPTSGGNQQRNSRRRSFKFATSSKSMENLVWQNELAPRQYMTTYVESKAKGKQARRTGRRPSLAVYTTSGEAVEIHLDEKNADGYVHLVEVYAFKLAITANKICAEGGQEEGAAEHLGLIKGAETSTHRWIVHHAEPHVAAGQIRVITDDEFQHDFFAIEAKEHRYAKAINVHAVLLQQDAKIKVLESLGVITEENGSTSASNSTITLATHSISSKRDRDNRNPDIDQDHQKLVGSAGDFLVQDESGHQWFVHPEDFHALYLKYKEYHQLREADGEAALSLQSRLKKWRIWRATRTQSPPAMTAAVQKYLVEAREWNFDIFRLSDMTEKSPLYFVGLELFQSFGLFADLTIDVSCFQRFLHRVESGYSKNIPYHNSMHGADVCQACAHMLDALKTAFPTRSRFPLGLSSLEVTALFLSALAHDLGHPGTNNAFEIATSSSLALCYNDRSVLESYHVSECFSILKNPSCDIFRGILKPAEWKGLRYLMIELVLATDLEHHRKFIQGFENACKKIARDISARKSTMQISTSVTSNEAKEKQGRMDDATTMLLPAATKEPPPGPKKYVPTTFDVMRELSGTAEGRMLIMKFIIKCSDISHPARTFPIHKRWSELIQEEFFRQGDKEAKLGLPVSRGMDRHSADNKSVAKGNVGFIQYVVRPLYEVMEKRMGIHQFSRNIETNKKYWEKASARSRSPSPRNSPGRKVLYGKPSLSARSSEPRSQK